ncbi:DUF6090 family protein [Algoriphagus aquimarinus]|uniref:DUF6090 family protein n=1 Tax=Algoriphagus aquimarinus TaxID=237018 RepID=UPI0030DD04FA
MIKLFRKIRQNLLVENKTGKYFKYAIGEIILVVIGILIALQINNWNQSRNQSKKELLLLSNLKNDIKEDIIILKQQDSIFLVFQNNGAIGIELFNLAKTVKDIDSVAKLVPEGLWNELYINNNTYNEMINSGNMYTMQNKALQKLITRYYLNAEANKNYIKEANNLQDYLYNRVSDINPFKLLTSQFNNIQVNVKLADTTWINDQNSSTYLAVANFLKSNQEVNNIYRRSVYRRNKEKAEILLKDITKELEIRTK